TDPTALRARIAAFRTASAVSDVEAQSALVVARGEVAKATAYVERTVRLLRKTESDELEQEDKRAVGGRNAARGRLAAAEDRAAQVPVESAPALERFAAEITRRIRTATDPESRGAFLREVLRTVRVMASGELQFDGPLMGEVVKSGEA